MPDKGLQAGPVPVPCTWSRRRRLTILTTSHITRLISSHTGGPGKPGVPFHPPLLNRCHVPLGSLSQQEPDSPGRRKSLAAPHPTIPHPCSQEPLGCSGGFSGSPHSSPPILQVGPWRRRADVGTQHPRGGTGILTQTSPSDPGGGLQGSAHRRNMEKGRRTTEEACLFLLVSRTPESPHAL